MVRVLLASPYDDGLPHHSGGIALWAKNLEYHYKHLNNSTDVSLDVLACNRSKYIRSEDSRLSRLISGAKDYYDILKKINKKLKSRNYDVIHICSSASFGLLRDVIAIKIARRCKTNIIIHFRFGRIPELESKNNWEWRLLKIVVQEADKIIVIDQKSYNVLRKCNFKNVICLPNPLQSRTEDIITQNIGIEREKRTVLFAGHIVESKGVLELVKACSKIDNIQLRLVGHYTPDIVSNIKEIAGENHKTWLELLGQLSYPDTIKEMLSCGVFVLPSYTEGFPNVILEAMACGCPIIATNVGAIPEMLDITNGMRCGICVKPFDVDGLRDAVVVLLNDEDYACRCGSNAKKRVKEVYSMSQIWNQLTNIWSVYEY